MIRKVSKTCHATGIKCNDGQLGTNTYREIFKDENAFYEY